MEQHYASISKTTTTCNNESGGGMTDTIDLSGGTYRRTWSTDRRDRRRCSVSIGAEAWLTRIEGAADDYGAIDGDPVLLHAATAGRRAASVDDVAGWVDELVAAGLLSRYDVDGDPYLLLADWEARQPAPRNGRRCRRYPAAPVTDTRVVTDASVCVQTPPGESGGRRGLLSQPQSQPTSQPTNTCCAG